MSGDDWLPTAEQLLQQQSPVRYRPQQQRRKPAQPEPARPQIERCGGCGGWLVVGQQCGTCMLIAMRKADA